MLEAQISYLGYRVHFLVRAEDRCLNVYHYEVWGTWQEARGSHSQSESLIYMRQVIYRRREVQACSHGFSISGWIAPLSPLCQLLVLMNNTGENTVIMLALSSSGARSQIKAQYCVILWNSKDLKGPYLNSPLHSAPAERVHQIASFLYPGDSGQFLLIPSGSFLHRFVESLRQAHSTWLSWGWVFTLSKYKAHMALCGILSLPDPSCPCHKLLRLSISFTLG